MDNEQLAALLQGMNETQASFNRRTAALELLLVGLMRAIKHNPDATLEIERAIAEFATGDAPEAARKEITALAQSIVQAAYE